MNPEGVSQSPGRYFPADLRLCNPFRVGVLFGSPTQGALTPFATLVLLLWNPVGVKIQESTRWTQLPIRPEISINPEPVKSLEGKPQTSATDFRRLNCSRISSFLRHSNFDIRVGRLSVVRVVRYPAA